MKTKTLELFVIILSSIAVISTPSAFAGIQPVRESNGIFTSGAHPTEGVVKITTFIDWTQTLSLEDFKTDNGPDLYVYLATDKNASDFVSLGKLKSTSGNQDYKIPEGTDPNKYTHVLIWCKSFGVNFGSSMISESVPINPILAEREAMEKKAMEEKAMMEKTMQKRVFFKGELTAPKGYTSFDGEVIGEYYVRVRNNDQVRVFAIIDNIPTNTNLEGWLVDTNTDYKLSLGKISEKGKLIFGQRMINPWVYDILVITEEPKNDFDPALNKPVGAIKLQTPFGQ